MSPGASGPTPPSAPEPSAASENPSVERALALAAALAEHASRRQGRRERARARRLARLLTDPQAMATVGALTDEVLRIRHASRAAAVLAELAEAPGRGLGPLDRLALVAGARLGRLVPELVLPVVRRRVLWELGDVVLPASRRRFARHARRRQRQGIRLNVNLLGEEVLGDHEAGARAARLRHLLAWPAVQQLSVKISALAAQLDPLRFDHEVERLTERLLDLARVAAAATPPKGLDLDMEGFRDLELTLAVFRRVLDRPGLDALPAGLALQAYLPDSLPALEELARFAHERRRREAVPLKVRLVKGANLPMERVEAELAGWPPAPFDHKADTDAHYKRLLEAALDPANAGALRVGVASHNVFDLAWAVVRAEDLGALDRLQLEMLEGMAPALARVCAERFGDLLLYAPLVDRHDLESAVAYLVRRLDEQRSPEHFLARQFSLRVGSPAWREEADRFRRAVFDAARPAPPTRRTQDRRAEETAPAPILASPRFRNEPDTDFTRPVNRAWVQGHLAARRAERDARDAPIVDGRERHEGTVLVEGIDPSAPTGGAPSRWAAAQEEVVLAAIRAARDGQATWAATDPDERARILRQAAAALARARGRLVATMAVDTGKTVREGDTEVSEAIDYAGYYATQVPPADLAPLGTVLVAAPWNFPLAIPAGGVLGALAAGNTVILKPAPEAIAVAAELVRVLLDAGVPPSALQFVPCLDGEASQLLVTHPDVDAVVLTGSWDTARLFLGWRPRLDLHAETSGKNALVVTATADLDDAIRDLVRSAFGHAGQKCSAASLAIVEAPLLEDRRFLRRLADAVRSLRVGPAWDLATQMGPLIRPPAGPLREALERLEDGERWLVAPRRLDEAGHLWSPGVKLGVQPGSPFHLTECFGPVLGVMRAADLDEAIRLQNQPPYGLTAGLHALDPAEIAVWRDRVQAGNLYVNRHITGAVVGRQPFGGWKRSVVGPGAKAGGPSYVPSLTRPRPLPPDTDPATYAAACRAAWDRLRRPVELAGLAAESNVLRRLPLDRALLVPGDGVDASAVALAEAAAGALRVHLEVLDLAAALGRVELGRKCRVLGKVPDAVLLALLDAGAWLDTRPLAADPAVEVQRWVREQAVAETLHRHGDPSPRRPGLRAQAS